MPCDAFIREQSLSVLPSPAEVAAAHQGVMIAPPSDAWSCCKADVTDHLWLSGKSAHVTQLNMPAQGHLCALAAARSPSTPPRPLETHLNPGCLHFDLCFRQLARWDCHSLQHTSLGKPNNMG